MIIPRPRGYEPPKYQPAADLRKRLNDLYFMRIPGRKITYRAYQLVWNTHRFDGMGLAEFTDYLRGDDLLALSGGGVKVLEGLRRAFGVQVK